jgi:hypothetical protein
MKQKLKLIIHLLMFSLLVQNTLGQVGINKIIITSTDLPTSDTIFNRKGAGVQSMVSGLEGRWDSSGTNFKVSFNSGNSDNKAISDIDVKNIGVGSRLPFAAIAKVRRVANVQVGNSEYHFPYFAAANSFPSLTETVGTFIINAPEVTSMEAALISNNINIGYDNIFQNNSINAHYGNIERIDYIYPRGFIPAVGADLNKIGFTIYDFGDAGKPFKIGGIKTLNNLNDPSGYITPLASITNLNYGKKLLLEFADFVVFQKDPNYSSSESRPSVVINQNIRGVFVSLASLGYVTGQKVYGFSIFANDIASNATESYLLNYTGFPTNTNSTEMLDLVSSIGLYTFNQNVVLSSTNELRATLQNENVLLQWDSSLFINAQKIYLQKSYSSMIYNDLAEFNDTQTSFIDVTKNGDVVYYRLKIIETNGEIKYSNIQLIKTKFIDTKIFPTVVKDQLYVTSNTIVVNKPIAISVFTVDGKLVKSFSKIASHSMNLDVSNLENAMYIISVTQNDKVLARQKIIKN